MSRIKKFTSVFGENWVIGRHLIPHIRSIGEKKYGVVLDLACGESPFREYFTEVGEYLRMDRCAVDSEVREGDMHAIPLESASIDLVILFQALSDVPVPTRVLEEISRILLPGGRIVVFESMSYPEHDMPYDYYRIMPAGLLWMARECGLETESCTYLGGLFTRFAVLWSNFVMGAVSRYKVLYPLAAAGTAAGNVLCYALDSCAMRISLASDYIAVLRKPVSE